MFKSYFDEKIDRCNSLILLINSQNKKIEKNSLWWRH